MTGTFDELFFAKVRNSSLAILKWEPFSSHTLSITNIENRGRGGGMGRSGGHDHKADQITLEMEPASVPEAQH